MSSKRKWDDVDVKQEASPAPPSMVVLGGGAESTDEKKAFDPAAAAAQAAAIAARINSTMGGALGLPSSSSRPNPGAREEKDKKDVYDGAFTKDIDINDLRNRYLITKGATQQQLSQETGASITTKGTWYPDRSKADAEGADPPLYLHIAAPSVEVLEKAVAKVNELIAQDLPPLLNEPRRFDRDGPGGPPPPGGAPRDNGWGSRFGAGGDGSGGGGGGPGGQRGGRWPEEKIPIGLESMRNFNVRAKIVGPAGMFVKFIQGETGTRVQIKGMGSGFIENDTGREAEEPMHINIAGPNPNELVRAKELAEDLLAAVEEEYQKAQASSFGGQGYQGGGYGQMQQGMGMGGGQQQQQQQADPYAAYGGYAAYVAQYNAQYGQAATAGTTGTPTSATPDGSTPQQPPLPSGQPPVTPGAAGATPAAAGGEQSQDPAAQYEAYRAYWAAYGYDVNDPQFQAWLATQQPGAGGAPVAPAA